MAACPSSMATLLLVACLPALCSALGYELKPKRVAKVKSGCSTNDMTSLALSQNKQNHLQAELMPKASAAFMSSDYAEFKVLVEKMTPKFCSEEDIMAEGAISYKAMALCIEKSMGVSEGCSQCYPNYLENMAGKSGMMEPTSCMKTCTHMTRNASDCITKVRNQAVLSQCLTPEIKGQSIPCLECSKAHIVQLAKCYKFGILQPDVQINGILEVIKKVKPSTGGPPTTNVAEVQAAVPRVPAAQKGAAVILRSGTDAAEAAEEDDISAEIDSEASAGKAEEAGASAALSEEDAAEQEKIAKIWQHMLMSGFSGFANMGGAMGQ